MPFPRIAFHGSLRMGAKPIGPLAQAVFVEFDIRGGILVPARFAARPLTGQQRQIMRPDSNLANTSL